MGQCNITTSMGDQVSALAGRFCQKQRARGGLEGTRAVQLGLPGAALGDEGMWCERNKASRWGEIHKPGLPPRCPFPRGSSRGVDAESGTSHSREWAVELSIPNDEPRPFKFIMIIKTQTQAIWIPGMVVGPFGD